MIGLIFASGFFSSSETALFYLSHDELRGLRVGSPRERMAAALLREPDRLLTAILFWNLVINLSYFAVSIVFVQQLVAQDHSAAAGMFGAVSLVVIIILGEVFPKSLAVVARLRVASAVSWPLAIAVRLVDPIVPPLNRITRLIRRTIWPHIRREPPLRAEDLERAVEISKLGADVVRQEQQVLHNILDLSEITVEEVMRPRGTYFTQPSPIHLDDLNRDVPGGYVLIVETGSDEIEQAISLRSFVDVPQRHLEAAAEEVVYVPWCSNLAYTIQLLRDRFCSVAVVVNEYGESIGIATYEDIIDTVLMPAPSRAKRLLQREPVLEIAPGRYHVDGITTLRYLSKRLNIEFEPDSDSVVTVAGLLHEELEQIPVVGDECSWHDLRIKVIAAPRPGQIKVLITRKQPTALSQPHPERN